MISNLQNLSPENLFQAYKLLLYNQGAPIEMTDLLNYLKIVYW